MSLQILEIILVKFLFVGTPINKLDIKTMRCVFPIWAIGLVSSVFCTFIIGAIVINKKLETIKFFTFMHFNILNNDEVQENIKEMKNDAFVSYR